MQVFKVAYTKPKEDKYLVKIDFGGDVGEKWCETTEPVVNYAKKAFKDGDEVEATYTEKDGAYNVTRVTKKTTTTTKPSTTKKETIPGKYVCEDCGKELKDDKYKKCYPCNKKNPVKTTGNSTTQQSIERQNVNNAVSRALISLQGQVDINNIGTLIDTLWTKFRSKLNIKE